MMPTPSENDVRLLIIFIQGIESTGVSAWDRFGKVLICQ